MIQPLLLILHSLLAEDWQGMERGRGRKEGGGLERKGKTRVSMRGERERKRRLYVWQLKLMSGKLSFGKRKDSLTFKNGVNPWLFYFFFLNAPGYVSSTSN